MIEGESGMGKSALLESFVGRRCDNAVIRWSRCDDFEQKPAFGLAGLLLDDGLSSCSEVAAGGRLLSVLGDLQTGHEGVVIVAIDDAQWIDRSSAHALRLALRRLMADRVLFLIARRPGYSDLGAVLTEDSTRRPTSGWARWLPTPCAISPGGARRWMICACVVSSVKGVPAVAAVAPDLPSLGALRV